MRGRAGCELEARAARRNPARHRPGAAQPGQAGSRRFLQKLVEECATPEQQGRYQAEAKKRDAHRRETAIHALVARLDRTLVLSSSQREQLLRLFESNWDEEWGVLHGHYG